MTNNQPQNSRSILRKQNQKGEKMEQRYVIVRTYSAGVFSGYLASHQDKQVVLKQARRLWFWEGAASLSQLSIDGTKKPKQCKFPVAVPEITLTEAIEILPCSEKARLSIESVSVWEV